VHGAVRRAAAAAAPAGRALDQAPAHERRVREPAPAERVLRVLLDNLPITIWVIDRDGTYLLNDGKALGHVGLKPGQLVGQNIFAMHPNADDPSSPTRRALAGHPGHSTSHAMDRWWESWLLPLREDGGDVTAVLGASLDITDARRVEDELRAQLALIEKQNEVIQELGTPIIEVWEGVLALPVVGLLDSRRAARMMDELLDAVAGKRARYAILDLTGVGAVDSATARHLVALAQAVRLLGAEGVVTGIRPAVAQTMVQMGLDLGCLTTLSNLREAIRYCARAAQADGRAAAPPARNATPDR
jgi:rsbT co-antagonist protein RsbR